MSTGQQWWQTALALFPVAVVVGMMLWLYLRGGQQERGAELPPSDPLEASKEAGKRVRERRQRNCHNG